MRSYLNPKTTQFIRDASHASLHSMHGAVLGPSSEHLALVVEKDTEKAPDGDERHICHDRRNVASLEGPGSDELGKAVSPDVLVDRNADEKTTCDGLVSAGNQQDSLRNGG